MRFGSVCSGIEAASVAWGPLGWTAAWLAEIEPFPSAVLAHHYPDVPNLGDMTALPERIRSGEIEAPDVFCGGTPCQAFSVAGLRKSLDDARGNLSLVFCEIADAIDDVRRADGRRPAIIFWENVPGVLSTKDNAFGCFLAGLSGESLPLLPAGGRWTDAGCVLGPERAVAWRVLDAQYFGLAQRRRRVFVVASARDGFNPAEVLFEWEGVRRDTAPSREAGKVAPTIPSRSTAGGGLGTDFDCDGGVITMAHGQGGAEIGFDRGQTLTCNHEAPIAAYQSGVRYANYSHDYAHDRITDPAGVNPALTKEAHASGNLNAAVPVAFHQTQDPISSTDGSTHALGCGSSGGQASVAVAQAISWDEELNASTEQSGTLLRGGQGGRHDGVMTPAMQVRRLTPVECERLQGFPEIKKTATITVFQHSNSNVCLSDQPSTNVLAALQSHKSLSNASPAEESVFPSNASAAALNLSASQASSSVPVLVSAQIDLERQHLRLHSQEKLLLSASIADANEWCLLPIQAGDFVQLSVAMLAALEKKTPRGKVELHLNTSGSFPLLIGNLFANQSGREIEELASDAGKFMSAVKKCTTSITSEAGRNSQNFESNLQTLLCSVTTAISSFIPREIRSASSYALSIEVSHGYTAIPWRKKPASECPDGPRYKALGNSWAVPVVRWIGARINANLCAVSGSITAPEE